MLKIIFYILLVFVVLIPNVQAKEEASDYITRSLSARDPDRTISLLKEAIKKFPTDFGAYSILFRLYEAKAFDAERRRDLRGAIRLLKESRVFLNEYYKAVENSPEVESDQHTEADELIQQWLKKSKKKEAKLWELKKRYKKRY